MAKVKKRKPDLRRIRPTKVYTLPEIAKTLDRDIATIRSWVRKGLPLLSEQKPVLVLGASLKEWLQDIWETKKQPCGDGELYCCGCRAPRKLMAGSFQILPRNEKTVSLKGLCITCGRQMNQTRSIRNIAEIKIHFGSLTLQMQHLSGCNIVGVKQPKPMPPFQAGGGG